MTVAAVWCAGKLDIVAEWMQTRAGATFFAKRIAGVGQRHDLAVNDDLHAGNGPLLDLTKDTAVRAVAQCAEVPAAGQVLAVQCPARPDLAVVLVRPDGYVGWAVDREPDGTVHTDGLTDALATWFGAGIAVSVRN